MPKMYSLRPEILVLEMDKMDVSITKISLDTTISRTSIFGRREYNKIKSETNTTVLFCKKKNYFSYYYKKDVAFLSEQTTNYNVHI
mgnify:CR=1 FL=1